MRAGRIIDYKYVELSVVDGDHFLHVVGGHEGVPAMASVLLHA